ncbi:hypothetical protein LXL04_013565 [Taraxacum kok-saghyz]
MDIMDTCDDPTPQQSGKFWELPMNRINDVVDKNFRVKFVVGLFDYPTGEYCLGKCQNKGLGMVDTGTSNMMSPNIVTSACHVIITDMSACHVSRCPNLKIATYEFRALSLLNMIVEARTHESRSQGGSNENNYWI